MVKEMHSKRKPQADFVLEFTFSSLIGSEKSEAAQVQSRCITRIGSIQQETVVLQRASDGKVSTPRLKEELLKDDTSEKHVVQEMK